MVANPYCPVVDITREERKATSNKWEHTIFVKLLGKRIGLRLMQARLARLWQPTGEIKVIDLDCDFFVVHLSNWEDYDHVFDGGPWVILGHYLAVQKKRPEFGLADGDLD